MKYGDEKTQERQLTDQGSSDEITDSEPITLFSAERQAENDTSDSNTEALETDSLLGRPTRSIGEGIELLGLSPMVGLRRRHQETHIDEDIFAQESNDGEYRQTEDYFDRDSPLHQLQRGVSTGSRALCSLSRQAGTTVFRSALGLGQQVGTQIEQQTRGLTRRLERWREEQAQQREIDRQIRYSMSVLESMLMGARRHNARGHFDVTSQSPNIGLSSLGVFSRSNMGVSSDGREETEAESIDRPMGTIEQKQLDEAIWRSLVEANNHQSSVISNRGVSFDARERREAESIDRAMRIIEQNEIEQKQLDEAIRRSLVEAEGQAAVTAMSNGERYDSDHGGSNQNKTWTG
ncbi:MAG: hypothetical protein VX737_03955 [Pseudomonadota bacterium]|nr:hypothetical protein [Pseudomonadota bacterium]